jgi:hypothetical protein
MVFADLNMAVGLAPACHGLPTHMLYRPAIVAHGLRRTFRRLWQWPAGANATHNARRKVPALFGNSRQADILVATAPGLKAARTDCRGRSPGPESVDYFLTFPDDTPKKSRVV